MKYKYELYESNRVKEYWTVYPGEQTVYTYILDENNKYKSHKPFFAGETIQCHVVHGLSIQVDDIFEGIEMFFEEE